MPEIQASNLAVLQYKKIENICLWGIKIPVFLIPLLPIYVSTSMLFPYVTGKNFAFRVLVELASVFWVGLVSLNKGYRPNYSAIVLSVFTFTFITGLADILGVNPYKSFWSNYERMEGYITILHLTAYFMIIRSVLRTRKDWMIFFNIVLASGFIVSLFALSMPTATEGTHFWMEYETRIYGTIGNPPFLAAYLLLTIFIGFIAIQNTKNKYLKTYYIILIHLSAVVIYLTATRGAILSGVVGLTIMSVFYISWRRQKWKPAGRVKTIAVIICLIAVAGLTIISYNNYPLKRDLTLYRLTSMFSDDSVKARLDSWSMAWGAIKEKPFLGWGQENFIGIYTVNPIPFREEQIWTDRAHNILIEWLINAGIPGLSAYLAILGSTVYTIRRKYAGKLLSKEETVTLLTALFVYFIQNLFTFDTINTYFIFFALMAYSDIIGVEKETSSLGSNVMTKKKRTGVKALSLTFLMLLIFSVIFYFANYRPIDESRRTSQIIKSASEYKSFSTLLGDFKNTLALNTFGDYDVRDKMGLISETILFHELFSEEGAMEFLKETVIELQKGKYENSFNLEYLTKVIVLYNRVAIYEPAFIPRAESLIKACMNINPRYEWLNYALAETYKLKKEYAGMFEIVRNMAALDPDNDQKQLKLALVAIVMKKEHVVNNALKEINRIRGATKHDIVSGKSFLEISDLFFIVKAYQEASDLQKVIHYLNQWKAKNPDRAQVRFNLANAYLNVGDETNALREIKKAAELNPAMYGEAAKNIMDISTK